MPEKEEAFFKPEMGKEEVSEEQNIFLKGPELIFPQEQKKEEDINFSFASKTREYFIGTTEGKPFLAVKYFDTLPKDLSKEEKELISN